MAAPWQDLPVRLERAPHRGAALAARIAPLKQLHRRHVAAVGDQECALASARHKAGRRAHNGTITADCHKARGIEATPLAGSIAPHAFGSMARSPLSVTGSATSGYGNDADTTDQGASPVPRT